MVPHVRAQRRARALHARRCARSPVPRTRPCPRRSKDCACWTWAPSTASTPTWPSIAAPPACWRSTTSSTSAGCRRAGASTLKGGEGFRAIGELIGSRVEYLRGDALALPAAGERFDLAFCSGSCIASRTRSGCCARSPGCCHPAGGCWWRPTGTVDDGRVDQRTYRGQAAEARSTRATTTSTGASRPADWLHSAASRDCPRSRWTSSVMVDGHPRSWPRSSRPA